MTDGPTLTQSAPLTREELDRIKLNYYSGFVKLEDAYLLMGALEAAWKERDDTHADRIALACQLTQAIRDRDELKETVKVLSERLADMAVERDEFEGRLNDIYSVMKLGVASPRQTITLATHDDALRYSAELSIKKEGSKLTASLVALHELRP